MRAPKVHKLNQKPCAFLRTLPPFDTSGRFKCLKTKFLIGSQFFGFSVLCFSVPLFLCLITTYAPTFDNRQTKSVRVYKSFCSTEFLHLLVKSVNNSAMNTVIAHQ